MAIKVVRVLRENQHEERKFIGTAFFVNKNTLITAKHVVEKYLTDDYKIYLTEMPNGGNVLISTTQIELCSRDIAVIKTQREYGTVSAVSYFEGLSNGIKVNIQGFHDEDGEECLYESSISGYTNDPHTFEIQDSRTNGLSGSPVIVDGEICGVAQAISPEKNITYIIPIHEICDKSIFKQAESADIYNSQKFNTIKELFRNMPIDLLKIKAYKYLPISYFGKIGNSSDEILDKLLEIGRLKEHCVPILSVLEEIEEERHHDDIVVLIKHLKSVKFSDVESYQCSENIAVSELSLLINFVPQDGKENLKLEIWRYANGETHRILEQFSEIDLENSIEINRLLDAIYIYCEEAILIYKSKIFIEIVLPSEKLYQNIKKWEDSNGFSLIRKYKYLFRLQSRFIKPDNTWKSKWDEMDIDVTHLDLDDIATSKFIEAKSYGGEIASSNYSVILKEKISNPDYLFEDVKAFGIPIVLSSLSDECNIIDVKNLKLQSCQESICTHMMSNHTSYKSDMFFMIDNPNKIPDEFKKPEQNLYGW